MVPLLFGSSWPDTNQTRAIGVANYWLRWMWVPLALACLVATIWLRHRQRERMLAGLLLTWFVAQALLPLAVNEGRYRKPFEGLLVAQCLLLASSSRRHKRVQNNDADRAVQEDVPHAANANA
jgi:hypothetical protein